MAARGGARAPCGAAEAETRVSLYAGGSVTHRSDIRLRPAQGELRFRGVAWDSRSFEMPIYYGLRVAHFLGPRPGVGLMLDFFPHVEATVAGQSTEGYQFPRGHVLQISAGIVHRFAWFLGGVLEYRFTHASVRVDVPGGDLSTRLSTHHIVGGAAVTLP